MADYVIRATAAEGQIRAFAATTRDLAEQARISHNTSPVATAALGRLLTAGVMMGCDMKGEDDLLTLKIQGDGPIGGLTVTADSRGNVKGYAFNPMVMLPPNEKGKLDVGGALGVGVLSVIKDIGLKEPYVGQTILVTGEIAEDLTYYYATSEQTPSSVALGVLMNKDNTVRQSGGFIIQLMPGASEDIIGRLEKQAEGDFVHHNPAGCGQHAGDDTGVCAGRIRPGNRRKASRCILLQLHKGPGGEGIDQCGQKGYPGNDRGWQAH